MTTERPLSETKRNDVFLEELLNSLIDPYHKRLMQTYITNFESDDPVAALENEFGLILMEQLDDED